MQPGADIDEAAASIKDQVIGQGPGMNSFSANSQVNMSYFLSNTLSRHLATRLAHMTDLPDLWSKAKISITFLQVG